MSTSRERQARYLKRQRDAGLTAVTLLVPKAAVADLKLIADALKVCPTLEVVPNLRGPSGFISGARKSLT
jgi:hypothetical protein